MNRCYLKVCENVTFGIGVKIWQFVNLYGCEIGDRTQIGSYVEIQKGAKIGKDCKISTHSFICEGVTIGDRVFVGHNVTFINDKYPVATNRNWQCIPTVVKDDVSIGSGATIMCGITIGQDAIVGAGAVVVKDVPEGAKVVGNPARVIGNGK